MLSSENINTYNRNVRDVRNIGKKNIEAGQQILFSRPAGFTFSDF